MAETMTAEQRRSRAIGIGALLAAGLCLSSAGLMTRHVEAADGWQLMFYRSVGMAVVLTAIFLVKERGRIAAPVRAMGWNGVAIAVVMAASMVAYLFALMLTSVANTMFIVSAAPFFAALLGWAFLRERVRPLTWLAIVAAVAGMAVMFTDGFRSGDPAGLFSALFACVTFAMMVVMLRRSRGVDMLPALILASIMSGIACFFIADDIAVSTNDMALGLLMGAVQTAGGFGFTMIGTRRVPAAEASLVLLVEPILSPLWVWIFVAETPSTIALVGGLIVLAAVMLQAVASVAWERRAAAA
jgi:drug/metabolite transporter (DMT)-like permease